MKRIWRKMMTEREVLEKLASYKDAIIKIKNERDSYKEQKTQLEQQVIKLDMEVKDLTRTRDILQTQLTEAQQQTQQVQQDEQAAKIEFLSELTRVLDDASDVLKD